VTCYLSGYAKVAGTVLSAFEPNITIRGQDIIGRYALHVARTCDAMDVNILLVSAIVAWSTPARQRLIAAVASVSVIVILNVTRICSLYYVGVYAPRMFEFVHIDLWPAIILLVAVGMFAIFIANSRPRAVR
jgi:exosortase/archaeosortase family protein